MPVIPEERKSGQAHTVAASGLSEGDGITPGGEHDGFHCQMFLNDLLTLGEVLDSGFEFQFDEGFDDGVAFAVGIFILLKFGVGIWKRGRAEGRSSVFHVLFSFKWGLDEHGNRLSDAELFANKGWSRRIKCGRSSAICE